MDDERADGDDRGDASELAALAADLVRIPTENPPGGERRAAEFVAEWFDDRGLDARLVERPSADRAQAVAWVGEDPRRSRDAADDPAEGGTDEDADSGSTLVFDAHLDVVPAGDPDRWSREPFAGAVADGVLYGRGSADTKGNLAAAMLALRDLAPAFERGDLAGSVVLQASMGEETGDPGTRTLIEAGYGGDRAVALEPTAFRVGTSAKGVATYRVGVSGAASHASRPDQGTNAVDAARPVLAAIDEYDARLREREDPLVGRAYATVTEFEAGTDSNMAVVPDRAELLLDRRVLPDETFEAVEREVEALLAGVEREAGVETDLSLVQYYAAAGIDADHALAERFRGLSADLADAPTAPWGLEAATDAREFVAEGIPAIVWGAGDLAQAHTDDEHVALADLELAREILVRAAQGLLASE